jgi:hypothetical protein
MPPSDYANRKFEETKINPDNFESWLN